MRLLVWALAAALLSPIPVHARPLSHSVLASYYGAPGERLNRYTADGERFRPGGLTAASRTLRFGSRLLVELAGRHVVVRVNDRGPFIRGRELDLSAAAARAIGLDRLGVSRVQITIL